MITMMPSWAERYGAPRVMAVEFPFGHPLGMAGEPKMQLAVVRDAIRVLAEAREPNTIVQLERKWPGDEREWRRRWQPAETSPLIVKYLDEIRAR